MTREPTLVDFALAWGVVIVTAFAVLFGCVWFMGWLLGMW